MNMSIEEMRNLLIDLVESWDRRTGFNHAQGRKSQLLSYTADEIKKEWIFQGGWFNGKKIRSTYVHS
jgi:hypothetical protein